MALTDKDNHKVNCKEMLENLDKERFDERKELTDEINQNNLTYYFKGNTARKRFDDSIMVQNFQKKSGDMKLEETKNLQNVFQSNLK